MIAHDHFDGQNKWSMLKVIGTQYSSAWLDCKDARFLYAEQK